MTSRRRNRDRRRRLGITLLELVLALALSVLVLGAISMAIHLNLRTLDRRRGEVEDSQLARAVLRMIADDLRSSVQYEVVDFSGVEQMASGLTGDVSGLAAGLGVELGSGGSAGAGGSGGSSTAGASAAGASGSSAGSNTEGIAEEQAPPDIPGLYGNQYELQVDVSRLPRVDEYSSMVTQGGATLIPSDVKTVAYYVRSAPLDGGNPQTDFVTPGLSPLGAGLVRRELPRVVTKYAVENGTSENLLKGGDLIAPEVVEISFRYFDGLEWLTEWDSQQLQGLPIAVEIVIAVQSLAGMRGDATSAVAAPGSPGADAPAMHRLVVRLPSAQLGKVPVSASNETTTNSSSPSGGTAP